SLVEQLVEMLSRHDAVETQLLYPARRGVDERGDGLADHSLEEHQRVRELLKSVDRADPADPEVFARFQECLDAVQHHVEEEESSVLPGMRQNLSEERLAELGRAFLESREQHLGEMPDDITKAEMEQQAANADIAGASSQSKDELASTLNSAAEE
ncbi:MAG: hemerythrin domain-containing protein, partial [Actinomycetota bacterium]|nr:hemerythrin domain-containing protein [Actinomycetota bacterium]